MHAQTLSRRPEAPTEKRQAIEAAVLQAMEELLAEGATYATLSIERIAKRAGISRTAFYFYFADKRELLMRLASKLSDELYHEADAWWSGAGDGPQQLTTALGKIAALYRAHGPLVRAIVEVSTYDDVVRADATLNPEATAFALVWMVERVLHQMLAQDGSVSDDELVRALARIWIATVYG
jgi:TetR/AcrR family transcriptional regulator, ethionamide resistance regulator